MIWGETTSIMGTHDTETENFFKGKISKCLETFLCLNPVSFNLYQSFKIQQTFIQDVASQEHWITLNPDKTDV